MAHIAQAEREQVDIGRWVKDGLFWVLENGEQVIDPIRDAGTWVVELLVDPEAGDAYVTELPWYVWPIAFAIVCIVVRRPTQGLRAAIALVAIRTLGPEIAESVAVSLSMIVVGVGAGAVMAVPVAVVAHLSTGLRRIIRRLADTTLLLIFTSIMLPLVFVFGLGVTTAIWTIALITVAAMTKAVMLAIGSIGTDTTRAGQELAAGLNTSLVLSAVLQSSFALIGAGGIGRLVFRASNNLNLDLHVDSSLAILALAVAFDQITRPTGRDGVFLDRTHAAWGLPTSSDDGSGIPTTYLRTAPPTVVGSVVALVGLLLPWSSDRGTVTSHVREADLALPGSSFNGIDELGGGGFGVAIGVLAVGALVGVALRAGRRSGPPADFTTVIGAAITIVSIAFLTTAAAPFAASSGLSLGAIVSLVGGLLMLLGTAIQSSGGWMAVNESARLGYLATVVSLCVAGGLVVLGSSIGWVVDYDPPQRAASTDIQAEIDRLTENAGDDINKQIAAAQEESAVRWWTVSRRYGRSGPGRGSKASATT